MRSVVRNQRFFAEKNREGKTSRFCFVKNGLNQLPTETAVSIVRQHANALDAGNVIAEIPCRRDRSNDDRGVTDHRLAVTKQDAANRFRLVPNPSFQENLVPIRKAESEQSPNPLVKIGVDVLFVDDFHGWRHGVNKEKENGNEDSNRGFHGDGAFENIFIDQDRQRRLERYGNRNRIGRTAVDFDQLFAALNTDRRKIGLLLHSIDTDVLNFPSKQFHGVTKQVVGQRTRRGDLFHTAVDARRFENSDHDRKLSQTAHLAQHDDLLVVDLGNDDSGKFKRNHAWGWGWYGNGGGGKQFRRNRPWFYLTDSIHYFFNWKPIPFPDSPTLALNTNTYTSITPSHHFRMKKLAVVMAAGKGTRMKSDLPKVLFPVCGRPMVEYVLDALETAGIDQTVVVVGYRSDLVRETLAHRKSLLFAEQTQQLGTGHAVMSCREQLREHDGSVMVVAGDCPMIQVDSIRALFDGYAAVPRPACVLGTANKENPTGLGRIVRDASGEFSRIVEEKDATEEQKGITEVNMSYYVFHTPELLLALNELRTDNSQGEYYITDVPAVLKSQAKRVVALPVLKPIESLGINTVDELAVVEQAMKAAT